MKNVKRTRLYTKVCFLLIILVAWSCKQNLGVIQSLVDKDMGKWIIRENNVFEYEISSSNKAKIADYVKKGNELWRKEKIPLVFAYIGEIDPSFMNIGQNKMSVNNTNDELIIEGNGKRYSFDFEMYNGIYFPKVIRILK